MKTITPKEETTLCAMRDMAAELQSALTAVGQVVADIVGIPPEDSRISNFINGEHLLDFYERCQIEVESSNAA